jgi:hypothetical protein
VVRRWVKLGDWSGAARTFTLPKQDIAGADAVAVLVQSGSKEAPGPCLARASPRCADNTPPRDAKKTGRREPALRTLGD